MWESKIGIRWGGFLDVGEIMNGWWVFIFLMDNLGYIKMDIKLIKFLIIIAIE